MNQLTQDERIAVRHLMSLALAGMEQASPYDVALRRGWTANAQIHKAAMGGLSTITGEAGAEIGTVSSALAALFGLVVESSIPGRLGLVEVPLHVSIVAAITAASASWVREGKAAPVSAFSFQRYALPVRKIVTLVVVSNELITHGGPKAELAIRNEIVRVGRELIDLSFIDPSNAGVANTTPASITNGLTGIASSGSPAADAAEAIAAHAGDLSTSSWVMHPTTAAQIGLARDTGGSLLFPDVGPRGGSWVGLPVVTSRAVPFDSTGGPITLVDGAGIAFGSQELQISISSNATIEMTDAPTGDVVTPVATTPVSLWQTNSQGMRCLMQANWKAARPGSVTLIENALYATS